MQHNRRHDDSTPEARIAALAARVAALEAELAHERQRLTHAFINPVFGCLTRAGVEDALKGLDLRDRVIVYLDIDDMKACNARYGMAGVNVKIAAALAAIRKTDIVSGQWFSGDEFIGFVYIVDALAFARRWQAAFKAQGLGCTVVVTPIAHGIYRSAKRAEDIVTAAKNHHKRGGIIWDL